MWYFAWILGLGLAVLFGVLNGVWHEFQLFDEGDEGAASPLPQRSSSRQNASARKRRLDAILSKPVAERPRSASRLDQRQSGQLSPHR